MNYSQIVNDIYERNLKTPEQIKVEQQDKAEKQAADAQRWERLKQSDESYKVIEQKLVDSIISSVDRICNMALDSNFSDAEIRHRLIQIATQRALLDNIRFNSFNN